jgi:hypothetical protein
VRSFEKTVLAVALALLATVVPSIGLNPASADEVRPITLPIDPGHVEQVRWSDTWGASRGGGRSHIGVDMLGAKMIPLVAVKDSVIAWGRFDNARGSILKLEDSDGWQYQYIHFNNDTPGTDDKAGSCTDTFSARICGAWNRETERFEHGFTVSEGEFVGYMGDGGNAESTTPHLHFEVYKPFGSGVTPINPTPSVDAALQVVLSGPLVDPALVAPWASFDELVEDLYQTTYGRSATAQERADFATDIRRSGLWPAIAPRVGEFSAAGVVDRLYFAFFQRRADQEGLEYWLGISGGGTDVNVIAENFALGEEFLNAYGDSDFSLFLDALYTNVLNRPSDEEGKAYWLSFLESGELDRGSIVVQFTESLEMRNLTRNRSEITVLTLLRDDRMPTAEEITGWTSLRANRTLGASIELWYGR